MFMNTSTLNNKKDPFKELSNEWWDENGEFQLDSAVVGLTLGLVTGGILFYLLLILG